LIEPLLIEYDAITLATTALNTTQQLEEDAREYEYDSPPLFDQAEVQPERDPQVRESSFERSPLRNLLHPLELRRQVELTIHLVQPTPLTPASVEKEKENKIRWNKRMEEVLFLELLEQANNGKSADNGFKKEAWVAALDAVMAVTTQWALVEQCSNKNDAYKTLWKEWMWIGKQSGFGFDESIGLYTARDSAWEDLIKVRTYY
jgi:Myb/SANT-like DNA-binding domain